VGIIDSVGLLVGESLGLLLGLSLGETDGEALGFVLGTTLSVGDCDVVGPVKVLGVGLTLKGELVGDLVSSLDGGTEGLLDGEELG